MKKITLILLSLSIVCLSFMGCEDEQEPAIDPSLLVYVEDFIFEANERDYVDSQGNPLDINTLDLEVKFTNISNSAVIGRCNRESRVITIDPIYWKTSSELVKEYIMFHEMGHCVLSRDHSTIADNTNTCLSIMEPGTGEICQSNYTSSTRESLLDELFNF